jgi:MFS family permease
LDHGRTYSRNIPRFFVFQALANFFLWTPIWIIFLQDRGLTLRQIGVLDAISWVLIASFEVPTGVIADTWGRKATIVAGALLNGLALIGLMAGVLSPLFLLAYFSWGLTVAFYSGTTDALLYDSLRADGRADDYTHIASRWSMTVQTSAAVSGILGGLIAVYDMRLCFLLTAGASFAAAGVALTLREPPREQASSDAPGYWGNLKQGVSIAAARPRVRYLLLFGAIIMLFPMLLTFTMFQPYTIEVGLPVWTLGGIMLGTRLASVAGSYLSPIAARRVRREQLLVLAPAGIIVAQLLIWLGASAPMIVLFAIVAALGSLLRPVLSAMLNDAIPSGQRATIISVQGLLYMLVMAAIQPLLFEIGGRASMALAIGVGGLIMLAMTVPVLMLLARTREQPELSVALPATKG